MKRRPDPLTITLAAQFEDLKETDAGWTYRMMAQFYNVINDRPMLFFNGSFAKTNRERVPRGAVKIIDGHPFDRGASNTLGYVLDAQESPRGNAYTGFLSRSSESVAQKIADRTLTENSVHVHLIKAEVVERPIEEVPEHILRWTEIAPSGMAMVLGVSEVMWIDVGLVPASSQDREALIEAPSAVSYQDLPVVLSRWDPDGARERVREWANAGEDVVRLSQAHLVQLSGGGCFGQIADVVDGRLVVVKDALLAARGAIVDGIGQRLADPEIAETLEATDRLVDRYGQKLPAVGLTTTREHGTHEETVPESSALSPAEAKQEEPVTAQSGGAEPSMPSTPSEPLAPDTHSDDGSEIATRLQSLVLRSRLHTLCERAQGVRKHVPTGISRESTTGGRAG